MKRVFWRVFTLPLCLTVWLGTHACKVESDGLSPTGTSSTGRVAIELTDAPIDDASVRSVFVTVTEVNVDGKPFSGFTGKKTIDVLALQNGRVEGLGVANLEAGTYSNVSLVLDYATDANGNAPGCYVLTTDNQKHNLGASGVQRVEVKSNQALQVAEKSEQTLVMDFDLRKAVKDNNGNSPGGYIFAGESELQSTVRVVNKNRVGSIVGKSTNSGSNGRVVVYAYKKGQFNRSAESANQFANAVNSATVDASGNYKLSFLEEGDYDICFASYQQNPNGGSAVLRGVLSLGGGLSLNGVSSVSVKANTEARLDVTLGGLLSL
ncbi:hypothetical protein GCM10023187_15550 [Nibrella viscosa]|uniref:GOLD domain-containing protein n=1 Tax=Nibrella viscosa TaxID=1084524 RepID=A0ABP8K6G9_9BACT